MSNALKDYFTVIHHYNRGLKTAGQKREFARKTLAGILSDPEAPQAIKNRIFPIVARWIDNVG